MLNLDDKEFKLNEQTYISMVMSYWSYKKTILKDDRILITKYDVEKLDILIKLSKAYRKKLYLAKKRVEHDKKEIRLITLKKLINAIPLVNLYDNLGSI